MQLFRYFAYLFHEQGITFIISEFQKFKLATMVSNLVAALRLMHLDLLRGLGSWRWGLVVPIFAIVGSFYGGLLRFDFIHQQPRNVNVWDVPPVVVSDHFLTLWFVTVGFVLLIGDGYLRERNQHTLALTLIRAPSRTMWWIAKLLSLGGLAICYVGLVFASVIVGSLFSVPFALHDSAASLILTTGQDGWYYRVLSVPMPLFVLLIAFYTATTLWIVGAVVLTASLVWQRMIGPLVIILMWGVIGQSLTTRVLSQVPYGKLLNIAYLVTYSKHLSIIPAERMSVSLFLAVAVSTITLLGVFGAWRLQQLDI